MSELHLFLSTIEEDARITSAHISVYMALWKKWVETDYKEPLSFFRSDLIGICKISSLNTYHKIIRQLHEYGYIKYMPSYNHFLGSLVYFTNIKKDKA